jgi:hypothetical protein
MWTKLQYLKTPLLREIGFAFLLLIVFLPQPYLPIPGLDASWQGVLEAGFFNHWEFGTTLNFTGGPLSFLYTPTSLGYYVYPQILAEATVIFLSLLLIFRAMRNNHLAASILVFLCLLPGPVLPPDAIFLTAIVAASFMIIHSDQRGLQLILLPFLFAVLSMMKFTFGVLAIFCIITTVAYLLWQKERRSAMLLIGSYFLSFVIIWIGIGQNLSTIPMFFVNSFQISQGYLWNMNQYETGAQFAIILCHLILVIAGFFLYFFRYRNNPKTWFVFLIGTAGVYLAWKAGITRAGYHLAIFLQSGLILAILIQPNFHKRIWPGVIVLALTTTYVLGLNLAYDGGLKPMTTLSGKFLSSHIKFLTEPGFIDRTYTTMLPALNYSESLPKIKEEVKGTSVDVLQSQQNILFLNDLNYQPRPTIQNYHGFNHHLLQLNLAHIRKNPPDYILSKHYVIDARFPFSDDSLYNFEVIKNYAPVLTEKDYLLLKRDSELPTTVTTEKVVSKQVTSDESVDVLAYSESALWLKIDYRPSLLHRLAAFLYKPEILMLQVEFEDGSSGYYRLPGGVLEDGFLLNPVFDSNETLAEYLTTFEVKKRISHFAVSSFVGHSFFRTTQFEIEVSALTFE